jgi:tRNA nucleotidyltransferase (CCA-adding enzyme)
MAFYLSTKGVLHPYDFRYLQGDFEKARLEPTLIAGNRESSKDDSENKIKTDFYAIDVMSSPIRSMSNESTLDEIRALMKKYSIRHIPISDNKKFAGMISDRDLLKLDMSGTFSFIKAKDVMNTLVIVCNEETPLAHIARVLLEEKISALPVINSEKNLSGIISRSDILKVVIYNKLVLR